MAILAKLAWYRHAPISKEQSICRTQLAFEPGAEVPERRKDKQRSRFRFLAALGFPLITRWISAKLQYIAPESGYHVLNAILNCEVPLWQFTAWR